MVLIGTGTAGLDDAAVKARLALAGQSGPSALIKNFRVFGIASFACLGGLLYGYNQGVFSGVLTMNSFGQHMGVYTTDSTKKGWLTSILELGAWFGALFAGFVAEILSRKYSIIAFTGVFIVGVIIQCTATTASGPDSILAGRFIVGLAIGPLSMIVPMYVAECAPSEVRGLLVGLQQVAIEFGIMISFWIDYGTNFIGGNGEKQSEAAWLVPLTLQLAPALVLIVGMVFMPFSPRWLVHHGREAEARKTLALLRKLPEDNELIELEFLEIKAQSLFEKRTTAERFPHLSKPTAWNILKLQFVAVGSLFRTKPMFRRVIVATMTMTFQQWTGINAVLYYAPQIFANLGLSSQSVSLLATGVVGVVMLIATIPAVLYIDKIGRKPILAGGAIGMAFCHFVIGIITARDQADWAAHSAAGWAAVTFVWIFAVFFGASWGPASWILVAEIWPLSARPYGIALGTSANWMNNFIVGQVTPDMLTHITYGTYVFFGLITTIGAAFIWYVVPETKRLTLEEMDVIFGSAGVASADADRMKAITKEVGLEDLLRQRLGDSGSDRMVNEKEPVVQQSGGHEAVSADAIEKSA